MNLREAVNSELIEEIEKSIVSGEDVNDVSVSHATVLNEASTNGSENIVKLLIKNGADPNKVFDESSWSPLINAVTNGHLGVVELLLQAGANPNWYWRYNACYPLKHAYDLTMERPDPNHLEYKRNIQLYDTGIYRQIAKVLLKYGADPNAYDEYGDNFIMRCLDVELLSMAIEKGANLNSISLKHKTPVLFFHFESPETFKLLIEKGINLEIKDGDGFTALLYSCYHKHATVYKALLEAGADIGASTTDYMGVKMNVISILKKRIKEKDGYEQSKELLVLANKLRPKFLGIF